MPFAGELEFLLRLSQQWHITHVSPPLEGRVFLANKMRKQILVITLRAGW